MGMSTEKHSEPAEPLKIKGITIPIDQQCPLVLALLAIIQKQDQEIQELRDEIQRLKKITTRPTIKPSKLLKPPPADPGKTTGKRTGSTKRKKTKDIRIDHDEIPVPANLPDGATLEG